MDDRKTVIDTPPAPDTGRVAAPSADSAPTAMIAPPTNAVAQGDLKIGQMFGGYEIIRLLGRGGMGAVYLAKQVKLDRLVVVKVIAPALASQPEIVGRLQREARAAAKITSDHVVQVYDCDAVDGIPFIAMEYVEGVSLDDHIEKNYKLSPGEATRIIYEAALGLKAAHDVGVLHRDIKPANLLMAKDGRIKVADFGLAKNAAPAGSDIGVKKSVTLSVEGQILGTPAYMAPEQADAKPVDARADLYALGVTYYELLTGELPFKGSTPLKMIAAMLSDPLTPPRQLVPTIPEAVENIVLALMARDRYGRPASADALLKLLDDLANGGVSGSMVSGLVTPVVTTPTAPIRPTPAPARRTPSSAVAPALDRQWSRVPPAPPAPAKPVDWTLLAVVAGALTVLVAVGSALSHRRPVSTSPEPSSTPATGETPPPSVETELRPSTDPPIFTSDPEELRREAIRRREREEIERAAAEGHRKVEERVRNRATSTPPRSSEPTRIQATPRGGLDEATYRAGLQEIALRKGELDSREFALRERETEIRRGGKVTSGSLDSIQREIASIQRERCTLEVKANELRRRYDQGKGR